MKTKIMDLVRKRRPDDNADDNHHPPHSKRTRKDQTEQDPCAIEGKSQSSQESHFSPEALATFRHQFLRDLSRRAQLLRTVRRGSAQRAGLPLSSKGHHPLDSILQQQQELKRSLASKQRGTGSRDSKRWSATIRAL
nr:transmembrane protein 29 isoform X4 [Rattus norvegicus]